MTPKDTTALEAREARLPVWAKRELARLRSDLALFKNTLAEVRGDALPEMGRAVLFRHDPNEENQVLDGFTVGFHGYDLQLRMERGALMVHSRRDNLYVRSGVSNLLYVVPGGDFEEVKDTSLTHKMRQLSALRKDGE